MPAITIGTERSLCPAGQHTLTLVEVAEKEFPAFNGEGNVTRWMWRFLSSKTDENGLQYEAVKFTGLKYGDSRAALTAFLDMLIPGLTKERASRLNTDDLIGKEYQAQVRHTPDPKDATKKRAEIIYIEPLEGDAVCYESGCGVILSREEIAAAKKYEAAFDGQQFCTEHGKVMVAIWKAKQESGAAEKPDPFVDA